MHIHRTYPSDIAFKIYQDEKILNQISMTYRCLEMSAEMVDPLIAFDQIMPNRSMTIEKKIDFLLWALGGIEKQ